MSREKLYFYSLRRRCREGIADLNSDQSENFEEKVQSIGTYGNNFLIYILRNQVCFMEFKDINPYFKFNVNELKNNFSLTLLETHGNIYTLFTGLDSLSNRIKMQIFQKKENNFHDRTLVFTSAVPEINAEEIRKLVYKECCYNNFQERKHYLALSEEDRVLICILRNFPPAQNKPNDKIEVKVVKVFKISNAKNLTFSPFDNFLAFSSGNRVYCYSLKNFSQSENFECSHTYHHKKISALHFLMQPNFHTQYLISAGADPFITFWPFSNSEESAFFLDCPHLNITSLALSMPICSSKTGPDAFLRDDNEEEKKEIGGLLNMKKEEKKEVEHKKDEVEKIADERKEKKEETESLVKSVELEPPPSNENRWKNVRLYGGTKDGRVLIWNLGLWRGEKDQYESEIQIDKKKKIKSIRLWKEDRKLAVLYNDKSIRSFCLETGQQERKWQFEFQPYLLAFSSCNSYLFITIRDELRIIILADYFYKSSFAKLKEILEEDLTMEEYEKKYYKFFRKKNLERVFCYDEGEDGSTIFHLFARLAETKDGNDFFLKKSLEICERFEIVPRLSRNFEGKTPLDILVNAPNTTLLNEFLRFILKIRVNAGMFPCLTTNNLAFIAKKEPTYLKELVDMRLREAIFSYDKPTKHQEIKKDICFSTDRLVFSSKFLKEKMEKEGVRIKNIEGNQVIKDLKIKILDFLNIMVPKHDNGFINSVCELNSKHEVFGSRGFRLLVDFKWKLYARRIFFQEAIIFLSFLICVTLNGLVIMPTRVYSHPKLNSNIKAGLAASSDLNVFAVIGICIDCILFLYWIYFFVSEVMELLVRKRKYFSDLWNYFDIPLLGFLLSALVLNIISTANGDSDGNVVKKINITMFFIFLESTLIVLKSTFAVTLFLSWIRMLTFARGFSGLAFMVRLLIEVFIDMKNFFILMFFLTITVSFSGKPASEKKKK